MRIQSDFVTCELFFFSDCMRLCDLVAFRQTYEDGEKTKTGRDVNQYIIFIIYILYIADCMLIQNFKDLAEHQLQYENHEIQSFVLNQIRSTNC